MFDENADGDGRAVMETAGGEGKYTFRAYTRCISHLEASCKPYRVSDRPYRSAQMQTET